MDVSVLHHDDFSDPAALLESEKRVLERIATGGELKRVLEEVAGLWERHSPQYVRCAVLMADEAGVRLQVAAAPSLPPFYHELAADSPVAVDSNPCGVAAWSKSAVVVEDFESDLRWGALREAAVTLGFRAGWSQPILSTRGKLLGTFAVYASHPGRPTPADTALMDRLSHLVRIAIEKFQAESTIERLFNFDTLTGLPNRSLMLDRLDGALLRARECGSSTALLLFNLDGMKQINDALGYEAGDRFLKSLANRLRAYLQPGDTFARVGGDEFGIVFETIRDEARLPDVLQALLANITQSMVIDQRELFVTASIGISLAPRNGTDADTLFKHADVALRRAKLLGRNGFQFYTADMNKTAARRLALMTELRNALGRGEFRVHYQPQIELGTGRITGAEALLRWQHPVHGTLMPAEFIPLLEESGLIVPVGEWTLMQVCEDIARLNRLDCPPSRIAVNLSARQFRHSDLAGRIEAILQETGVLSEQLTVEITESLIVQEPEAALKVLQRLKAMNVNISMDDFGTGYSSLSNLKKFPIDELKIDKSFVDGVTGKSADAAIVDAVIHMAHSLGMTVVAEGVESPLQLAFLETRGCDQVQGYLLGEPVDAEGLHAFLARGHVQASSDPMMPTGSATAR